MLKYFVTPTPKPSTVQSEFKMLFTFEKRKEEADRIIKKYPNKIPVIVEKSNSSDVNEMKKKKYLIPLDFTIGQLLFLIRKNVELDPSEALILFAGNTTVPSLTELISNVYDKHKDHDGFLYFTYSREAVFG